jgi:hypothetical protein
MTLERLLVAAIVAAAAWFVLAAVRRSLRGADRCACGLPRCPAARDDKTDF